MATGEPAQSSAPTPEQRDTAQLLRSLFGHPFADRFLDFCRLTNEGADKAVGLRATLPLAAHAMREMESFLRQVLRGPFGTADAPPPEVAAKLQQAKDHLVGLGFEADKVGNLVNKLHASTHAAEIAAISARLGLAPDGETAKAWKSLVNRQQRATHRRTIHEREAVDEEFRRDFARPFQSLVHDVAMALRRRYADLIPEVDKLVAEPNRLKAVTLFRDNIPGTPALQERFFQTIDCGDWLAPLMEKGLLREPVPNLDDAENGVIRWNSWAPAHYLKRMAASADGAVRAKVLAALRELKFAEDFALRDTCFEIAAILPSAEAALLVDVAVEWLKPRHYWTMKAPEQFLLHLIKGGERDAVLEVARMLFMVTRNEAGILTRYDRFDYEHSLPPFVEPITKLCGVDALALYCDLLEGAAIASQYVKSDPPSDYTTASAPLADRNKATHDIYAALAWAVKYCAEQLIAEDKALTGAVVDMLMARRWRIFLQLALDAAILAPAELGPRAATLLKDTGLLGQPWCARQYGALARIAYPGLSPQDQAAILAEVDAAPERNMDIWKENYERIYGNAMTEEDVIRYTLLSRRDALWHWREVLPKERRDDIEQIAAEYGAPHGEDDARFAWEGYRDVSPVSAAEIIAKPVAEVAEFLKSWKPGEEDEGLTISALGTELRIAIEQEPEKFAAAAILFSDLGPHYSLRYLEGLDNQARNRKPFDWSPVLAMLAKVIATASATQPGRIATDRENPGWSWVLLAAASLVRSGLYDGPAQFPKSEHAKVAALIEMLWAAPALEPDDLASRRQQDAYFGAQATLRGTVLEAAILFGWRNAPEQGEAKPERALPPLTLKILDAALALDEAHDPGLGAIIGHWFGSILFLDPVWVEQNAESLCGAKAHAARKPAFWDGYLSQGRATLEAYPYLEPFLRDEIARVDSEGYNEERRGKPLMQMLLSYYYEALIGLEPGGMLAECFARAPAPLREHASWFMHNEVDRIELAPEKRERLHQFYEWRLAAAKAAPDRPAYRRELGMLGLCMGKNPNESCWLLAQIRQMAEMKLTPPHPIHLFTWLEEMAADETDSVIATMHAILEDEGFDQWMFMQYGEPVKAILRAGLASTNPKTAELARECANILVSRNHKDVLELVA